MRTTRRADRRRRALLPLLPLALAATALTACGEESGLDGLAFPVDQDGPYRAGYRTIPVTYTAFDGSSREIEVALWYPTNDVHVAEGGPDDTESPRYQGIFSDPDTIVDASLAPAAYPGGYPVVVHSHGHYGFPGNSFHFTTALARHGFVVAAPSHPDDTFGDLSTPTPFRSYVDRPLDLSATLDALEALPSSDPLASRLALERVVVSGHSRGTYTVFASIGATFDQASIEAMCDGGDFDSAGGCAPAEIARLVQGFADPRVVAGIPMAGSGDRGFFGETGQNDASVPILLMTGSEDDVGAAALVADLPDVDVAWLDVAGGCHQLYGFGNCSGIDDEVGQPIIRTYGVAFARRHLFEDADATVTGVLDGSIVVSELASFVP